MILKQIRYMFSYLKNFVLQKSSVIHSASTCFNTVEKINAVYCLRRCWAERVAYGKSRLLLLPSMSTLIWKASKLLEDCCILECGVLTFERGVPTFRCTTGSRSSVLKITVARPSETSILMYQIWQCHIPEGGNRHSRRCVNLNCH